MGVMDYKTHCVLAGGNFCYTLNLYINGIREKRRMSSFRRKQISPLTVGGVFCAKEKSLLEKHLLFSLCIKEVFWQSFGSQAGEKTFFSNFFSSFFFF